MQYVSSFSGGLSSFAATCRMIERGIPKDKLDVVFCDTLIEDEDLYRFVDDAEAHMGIKITRLKDGRHPWEVFLDRYYQGNSRTAPCSEELKTDLFKSYCEKQYRWECTIIVGMSYQEQERIDRLVPKYACRVVAPMAERPYLSHKQVEQWCESIGIAIPRLYKYGFVHNNCGGFCVRAGTKQFKLLYKTFPERYMWHEEQQEKYIKFYLDFKAKQYAFGEINEAEYRKAIEANGHPFLRKLIKGELKYITLKQFRENYLNVEDDEFSGSAGCGCFTNEALT